jgi:hypothetical protein
MGCDYETIRKYVFQSTAGSYAGRHHLAVIGHARRVSVSIHGRLLRRPPPPDFGNCNSERSSVPIYANLP